MWKRIVGVVVAVLLAVVGTGVLVTYVRTAEQRALADEELVDVLVVTQATARGTSASALADRVRLEQVPVKVRSEGAVDDLDDIDAGLVTAVGLVPGEQVLRQRFTVADQLARVEVPPGLLQVTVALDPQRSLGGNVRAGQTVAVLASFTGNGNGDEPAAEGDPAPQADRDTTHLILHKVLVTHVQMTARATTSTPGATNGGDGKQAGEENSPGTAPAGEVLVTLAVDAPSVERVVFAAEHGSLWLSAEPEEAPETGTTIQTRETIYR